jgi:hypothetical protein
MALDYDNNYILSYFDCSFNKVIWIEPIQRCKACRSGICEGCDEVIVQKKIWKQVRVPSSQHTSVLSATHASADSAKYPFVNWNQSSNSSVPSRQVVYVPSRGNSTRSTVTSLRPGALSAGGEGIDIKHNSYARYFSRINSNNLATCSSSTSLIPLYGNKNSNYGILSSSWCGDIL